MKHIDLTKSIFALTEEYPELIDILKNQGFLGLTNTVMRNTVGRATTIPQGCAKLNINIDGIVSLLTEKGFTILP